MTESIFDHSILVNHVRNVHLAIMSDPTKQGEGTKQIEKIVVNILELHTLFHDDFMKSVRAIHLYENYDIIKL